MTKQLNHIEFKNRQIEFTPNIVLVLENLEHEENIGSAFRLGDAFGVRKIIVVSNGDINTKKVEKTARNCTKNVSFQIVSTIQEAFEEISNLNCLPVSVEICDDSLPLRECDFSRYTGVALIVGNERNGVSQEALDNSAFSVHIDMFGVNSSINVSTALAIALYKCSEDYLSKKNEIELSKE